MQDVSRGDGRTILFVSHNMASVKALCSRGIILKNGTVKEEGNIDVIVNSYIKGDSALNNFKKSINNKPIINVKDIEVFEIGIKAKNKDFKDVISLNDKILLTIKYRQMTSDKNIHFTIHLKDELGNVVFTSGSSNAGINNKAGDYEVFVEFPDNFFNWGAFYIDLYIVENRKKAIVIEKDIISFTIINKKRELGTYMGKELGAIHPIFEWKKKVLN
jgi:lipopolysaccharide transport system ATP-binding protein